MLVLNLIYPHVSKSDPMSHLHLRVIVDLLVALTLSVVLSLDQLLGVNQGCLPLVWPTLLCLLEQVK